MSKQLAMQGADSLIFDINPEAFALKAKALESARAITEIISEEDITAAQEAASVAKGLAKDIETQRLAETAPIRDFLEVTKGKIDTYRKDLLAEVGRIERLMSDYVRQQREERERQERERQAAIRQAEEAAARLRQAEFAAAAAKTKQALQTAQAMLETARDNAVDAGIAVAEAQNAAPVVVGEITGAQVRPAAYDFEVEDVDALYEAEPGCVTLTPKRDAIKGLIAAGKREIPGVRIFIVDKVHVKGTSSVIARSLKS
jgi:hypothetical protein